MTKNNKLYSNLDFNLIFTIIALFVLGMLTIASATNVHENGISREVTFQGIAFIIGLAVAFFVLKIDYNIFGESYRILYILGVVMLLLVYVPGLGKVAFNARSWINLGIIDLQTSEITKILFILSFAKYVELYKFNKLDKLTSIIAPIIFCVPFLALLLKQPDLGTALVFCLIAFGILYVSGLKKRVILISILIIAVTFPITFQFLAKHQKDRFLMFLDSTHEANYQVIQSEVTVGSGKFFGRGLFKGVYHKNDFLPVKESDFIFPVAVEEMGFIGGAAIIILYLNLLTRMVKVAINAKDTYGSLVSIGITCMFAFQIMENIGMTIGIVPVTGVTLPFFSYGGSSVITSMISVGILMNINMRRKKLNF